MRFFILSIFFFSSWSLRALELQVGDVIVQSFDCYECRLIQSETNSPYVHSGVLIKDAQGQWQVAEALGPVGLTPLKKFLARGKLNTLYRPSEWSQLSFSEQRELEKHMFNVFSSDFSGLSFDSAFLWDNMDEQGKETLYCAEFVGKFLNRFLLSDIAPSAMSYKKHYDLWYKIMRGQVPDGLPGLSPASFTRSPLFFKVEDELHVQSTLLL